MYDVTLEGGNCDTCDLPGKEQLHLWEIIM